jgi:hypothetical protein
MTLIEKTNLVQYVKNDVERVGFLLLFLAHWSDGDFSLSEYKEYDFILMQMIEAGKLDLNKDGKVNRKDLKHAMDQITDAMAGSDLATVKNTVQLLCKHFMDYPVVAKEAILYAAINIVYADDKLLDNEKENVSFIKNELGV